jgi:hypothetical protein
MEFNGNAVARGPEVIGSADITIVSVTDLAAAAEKSRRC